jgi:hypothetical protein
MGVCEEQWSHLGIAREKTSVMGRFHFNGEKLQLMALRRKLINPHNLPGIASATMFDGAKDMAYCDTQLRVAFDGDAVLFSDEAEHITKEHGLDKFFQHETLFENKPLAQVSSVSSS